MFGQGAKGYELLSIIPFLYKVLYSVCYVFYSF